MSVRQVNINDFAPISLELSLTLSTNTNIITGAANTQLIIFLNVSSIIRLTIDGDSLRFLDPGVYILGVRGNDAIVYSLLTFSGQVSKTEEDCFTVCIRQRGGVELGSIQELPIIAGRILDCATDCAPRFPQS